jgi:putative ubiquitin-RnfH superfamily antitoxin RatB of RatAB toxin-antitoxin module
MKIQVVLAWPRRYLAVTVELAQGACVADALQAAAIEGAGQATGVAVFGVQATPQTVLNEGDRVELLRPLLIDPKEARRRRAAGP